MVNAALCQTIGRSSIQASTDNMEAMIRQAVQGHPDLDLIVFPEYCYGFPNTIGSHPEIGDHTRRIATLAKEHHVYILAGSFPRLAEDGRAYNSICLYDRYGQLAGRYDKTHLCVGIGYDESKEVAPGQSSGLFQTDFGTIGVMVCFELRFPEIPRTLVHDGADLILCPAAFPVGTPLPPRTDHWDVMVRATALQNLTWTLACNCFGEVEGNYPFGRSMAVDPWGTVTAQASGREEIVYVQADLDYQKQIRNSVGTWSTRRPELYHLD